MLEIMFVISLSRQIAEIATKKGRSAAGYVILLIACWIVGECIGMFVGGFISGVLTNGDHVVLLVLYPSMLICAGLGGYAAFEIAKAQAPMPGSTESMSHS